MPTQALADCFASEQAFRAADPLMRIAAIHHAAPRLRDNDALADDLAQMGREDRGLVGQYAALTLAQAGLAAGLKILLGRLEHAHEEDRLRLEACLRRCWRFPFAALLNQVVRLDRLRTTAGAEERKGLLELLLVTAEEFQQRRKEQPEDANRVLDSLVRLENLDGLTWREGRILGLGTLAACPRGEEPGRLTLPDLQLELQFNEDAVLNRDHAFTGRPAVYAAKPTGATQREGRIRLRARELWKQAGKPAWRDSEFWQQAEREYDAMLHRRKEELAYRRWEAAGKPWGDNDHFWREACAEMDAADQNRCEVELLYILEPLSDSV